MCVLGGSVERLDAQVLLDPLEEEFDVPAAAVHFGKGVGVQVEMVRQQGDPLSRVSGFRTRILRSGSGYSLELLYPWSRIV